MAQHSAFRKLLFFLIFLLLAGGGWFVCKSLLKPSTHSFRCVVAGLFASPPPLSPDSISHRSAQVEQMLSEIDYYEQTHTIFDDGYQQVMALRPYLQSHLAHIMHAPQRNYRQVLFARPYSAYDVRQLVRRWLLPAEAAGDTLLFAPLLSCTTQSSPLLFHDGQHYGRVDYPNRSFYRGDFVQQGSVVRPQGIVRQGRGRLVFPDGTIYEGNWDADTLTHGVRYTAGVRYEGQFDAQLRPNGFGVLRGEEYYEGDWVHGKRQGYGVGLIPGRIVCVGTWKGDRFRGEHIVHNHQRVYGIDIARYQHERGNRTYPILWVALRIKHLGKKIPRRVEGEGDFPVRFCYVKATQGVTLVNSYAAEDMFLGRRAGIHMGQYHFFSPIDGREQAKWFLQNASLQPGDLPPVLDAELSPQQMEAMGGAAAMLREMAAWVEVVKAHCHTTPLLYVSQSFLDAHWSQAPDELRQCPVWVARYSEYRPYYRLAFWQMSDDGVVHGITPQVDIDVFNGSLDQFKQFVSEYQIK
ncbi:MAG: hypothetical protein KBT12_04785 [Bacteroidales bacterium]|nr:hypothetical protein [Candidatus Physcousia equi]